MTDLACCTSSIGPMCEHRRTFLVAVLKDRADDYRYVKATTSNTYGYLVESIREAYASGMTYQSIGEAVGLTRQRVAKICEVRMDVRGLTYEDGTRMDYCRPCALGDHAHCRPRACHCKHSETRKGEE